MGRYITMQDRQAIFLALCFVPGTALGLMIPALVSTIISMTMLPAGYVILTKTNSRRLMIAATAALLIGAGMFAGRRGKECGITEPHSGFARELCTLLKEKIDSLPFREGRTAPLLKAFLTGDRSSMDSDTIQIFRSSGASHLLALSGLHLGIIYLILSKLLSIGGVSRKVLVCKSILIICLTGFYTLMTGASPSLCRAFLFILIREGCILLSRQISLLQCYCIAIMIQLSVSPASLLQPGFQLSYLAMLGICVLMPPLQGLYPGGKIKGMFQRIWDLAAMSIACQLFTAPLAWKLFGSFPRYFLLTNVIAMPVMTLTMISAIASLALSLAGICPDILLRACEWNVQTLLWILEIIAGI